MVYYETVKVTINAPGLAEIIINVVVRHYGLPDSIITDRGSFFTSKFWLSLCYFLGINRRLSIVSTHRRTVRPKGKIVQWKSTFEPSLISNRMIGHDIFP